MALRRLVLSAFFVLASSTASASPFEFAEHTPGYDMLSDGSSAYAAGFHFVARNHFQNAAYWADKVAQHNLAAMYYRGEGVDRDRARAWAWFELSAERGYPEFVGVADAVWEQLDDAQRQRARRIFEELEPVYGDEAAVERTQRRMERDRRQMTGSRVGFVNAMTIIDGSGITRDGEDFYAEDKWDFNRVIAREKQLFDTLARSRITLGELEFAEGDEAEAEDAAQP
jgi:hypothetical protein